ncbi:MAG: DNA-binding protein [Gammaproteobacteria bacterium]
MAQSKILLDTNAYFRLAKSIHPLLDNAFGENNYCLYVLKELDDEFDRNKRLRSQFHWVNEEEYQDNRKKRLTLSGKDRRAIRLVEEYLSRYKAGNELGVFLVDIKCLAHGHVLGIPVVTDDTDMLQMAEDFAIRTMKTLELLHLMLDTGHIDIDKVRQIAAYWEYISDKPAGFRKDYKRLFKEKPP